MCLSLWGDGKSSVVLLCPWEAWGGCWAQHPLGCCAWLHQVLPYATATNLCHHRTHRCCSPWGVSLQNLWQHFAMLITRLMIQITIFNDDIRMSGEVESSRKNIALVIHFSTVSLDQSALSFGAYFTPFQNGSATESQFLDQCMA